MGVGLVASLSKIHGQGDYDQNVAMSTVSSPRSKDSICKRRATTMSSSKPVTAALVEGLEAFPMEHFIRGLQ